MLFRYPGHDVIDLPVPRGLVGKWTAPRTICDGVLMKPINGSRDLLRPSEKLGNSPRFAHSNDRQTKSRAGFDPKPARGFATYLKGVVELKAPVPLRKLVPPTDTAVPPFTRLIPVGLSFSTLL